MTYTTPRELGDPNQLADAIEAIRAINRRLEQIIQMQLDEHAAGIKKLEAVVFSK